MYSGKAVAAGISGRAKLIPDITPENMATGMLTQWLSIEVGEPNYSITYILLKYYKCFLELYFHLILRYKRNNTTTY